MGDDLPNPLSDSTIPNQSDLQGTDGNSIDLTEVNHTVNDCVALVAQLEDQITRDINDCLNNCHGDAQLCQACILGDIADLVNRSGLAMQGCENKVYEQLNQYVGAAWAAAFDLGVPLPTQLQIQQALSGERIDFTTLSDTQTVNTVTDSGNDGNTTTINNVDNSNQQQVILPCPAGINPAALTYLTALPGGGYCTPYQWDSTAINNWCVIAFGGSADAHIALLPTSSTPGIWVSNGCEFAIPQLCPSNLSTNNTLPPPRNDGNSSHTNGSTGGGSGATGGSGSTSTLSGGGGGDTLGGGNGGNTTVPPSTQDGSINNPIIAAGLPNCIPQDDWTTNYTSFISNTFGLDAGNVYSPVPPTTTSSGILNDLITGIYYYLPPLCPSNTTSQGGGGNTTTTPVEPVNKENIPPGLLACDPDNLQAAVNNAVNLPVSGNLTPSDLVYGLFKIKPGDCPTTAVGALLNPVDTIGCLVANMVGAVTEAFGGLINKPENDDPSQPCSAAGYTYSAIANGVIQFFQRWTGLLPNSVAYANEGNLNYCFQYRIPDSSTAVAAYAKGYFTTEQAEFVWRFNGDCVPWQRKITELAKSRIGVQDAYRLFQLGEIDLDQLRTAWIRQGIDFDQEGPLWRNAIQQYPGMADLIRMMVRDVANTNTVNNLKLDGVGDSAFENNWTGTLKQWGNAQGVPDVVAQYYWRAHWQNPSPGSIYEWLHRLRPDDRDPDDPFLNLVFTSEDAKKALAIADYVPGLIDNYIATSYKPLNRVDIRRMWNNFTFTDEADVRRAYRDLGYNASTADQLTRFTVESGKAARAKLSGLLSVNDILTAYRNDLLTRGEADGLLQSSGLSAEQSSTNLDSADTRKLLASRGFVLKSLQSRYNRGEFTNPDAVQQLVGSGYDQTSADRIVANWRVQRDAKEKQPTIAMLCKWYDKGMITIDEMLTRVGNLNYNLNDALRIVQSCQSDVAAKRQKELQQQLDKMAKVEQQKNREAAAAARLARQNLRQLQLQHLTKHINKRVRKNGSVVSTVTDEIVDKPEINVTNTSMDVDITTTTTTS